MTKGKTICNALKGIRKQIADANDIHYEPRECNHQGECCGTCPACESEVRYIEKQLDIRRQLGKAVVVVGLSAGLFSLTGCTSCTGLGVRTVGMVEDTPPAQTQLLKEDTLKNGELMEEIDGYMAEPDSDNTECPEEESSANNDSQEK